MSMDVGDHDFHFSLLAINWNEFLGKVMWFTIVFFTVLNLDLCILLDWFPPKSMVIPAIYVITGVG